MTSTRVIDTQRLSTLSQAYEKDMVRFLHDSPEKPLVQRIRQEMEKVGFDEVRTHLMGSVLGRIGSGRLVIMMASRAVACGQLAGLVGMVYAGKLIQELGMFDDYTLWAVEAAQGEDCESIVRPDCVVLAEPTNLRICRGHRVLSESHPLAQAAIATYETLFELPPIVEKRACSAGSKSPLGAPAIAFGPGAPVRHLVQSAQFYAAFPQVFLGPR